MILELGTIKPATTKYAADEISPQISIVLGSSTDFSIVTVFPVVEIFKHDFCVVT